MKHLLPALALTVLCASSPAMASLLLHSDSFETGDPVSYTTKFGAPAIAGPANLFSSNALIFNNAGNLPTYYEQIEYPVYSDSLPYQVISIRFDFYVENLVGNTVFDRDALFVVFLDDYDGLNRMTLEPNGDLYVDNLTVGGRTTFSGFQNSQIYRFVMSYDLTNDQWGISINDNPLWNGPLSRSTRLEGVRFHLGGRSPGRYTGNFTNVVLDNVEISASPVPLPAAGWLLMTGVVGLLLRAGATKRQGR